MSHGCHMWFHNAVTCRYVSGLKHWYQFGSPNLWETTSVVGSRKNAICIIGPWMCVKQNLLCNSIQVVSYTCSRANDTCVYPTHPILPYVWDWNSDEYHILPTTLRQRPHHYRYYKWNLMLCWKHWLRMTFFLWIWKYYVLFCCWFTEASKDAGSVSSWLGPPHQRHRISLG